MCADRFSTSARRSSERTLHAARRPAISIPHATRAAQCEREHEEREIETEGVEWDAVERARDDPREQAGLHEHRQGGADSQAGVDGQQGTRRARTVQQARVEGAHRLDYACVAACSVASPVVSAEAGGALTRWRNTWNDQPWYSNTTGMKRTATIVITTSA